MSAHVGTMFERRHPDYIIIKRTSSTVRPINNTRY